MKLGDIFTSGMVFAAKKTIRIFGSGEGSAEVTFAGQTRTVVSTGDTWCTEFPPMEYGGPYELKFQGDGEPVLLNDLYIGEVYLFSGQSNMAFTLVRTNTPKEMYEDNDSLRYIQITNRPEEMAWVKAKREEVNAWSALGYLAGMNIQKDKKIHVGIILCAIGASAIESWLPEGTLEKIGIQIPLEEKHLDHYHEKLIAMNQDGFLYHHKLERVIPFSLSGAVWYQGESDASESEGAVYEQELSELIRIWRGDFRNEHLPFCIVQLADYEGRIKLDSGWRLVQEAQMRISRHVPNVYTVVSKDICETDDIHPQTKDQLAVRIAEAIKAHFFEG